MVTILNFRIGQRLCGEKSFGKPTILSSHYFTYSTRFIQQVIVRELSPRQNGGSKDLVVKKNIYIK